MRTWTPGVRSLVVMLAALAWTCLAGRVLADDPDVVPVCERTLAEVGRTRVIAFGLSVPAPEDMTFAAEVEDPDVLAVVREPAALSGRTLGYVRVLGKAPGRTALSIGGSSIAVEVVPPRVAGAPPAPVLVAPGDGAVVWGEFAVGAEWEGMGSEEPGSFVLVLSTGEEIGPERTSGPVWGPSVRIWFRVDADRLPEGKVELVAVRRGAGGDIAPSVPVGVRVVHPGPEDLRVLEAESPGEVRRPERFGTDPPYIGVDPEASGEEFVYLFSGDPAVSFPYKVGDDGSYQVMMRARGTFAGGAFPTVQLVVDAGDEGATSSSVVAQTWHRVALGVPVRLAAGEAVLTPYFRNDFYAEPFCDRNLDLDRIEILRVPDVPGRLDPGALRVAFSSPLDGRELMGSLEVTGHVWWREAETAPPPVVSLLVNGEEIASQRSTSPRFWVSAGHFAPGTNTVQLVATLDSGERAETPVQRLLRSEEAPPSPEPREFHRFPMRDGGWAAGVKERLSGDGDPSERVCAAFWSNGRAILDLSDEIAGRFEIFVEARGDDFEGPPVATIYVEARGKTRKVGDASIPGYWETLSAGKVDLPAGPKRLAVAFENDLYRENEGDRNLWLQSVILFEREARPDERAPSIEVLYPSAGHAVHGGDVVVARATDDSTVAWAELVVDGKESGIRIETTGKTGPIVFPLLAPRLAPGAHSLAVEAADAAGNVLVSEPVAFSVLSEPPASPGPFARAVHLANRFAYGPDLDELAAILTKGEEAWLADRLSRPAGDPGDLAAADYASTLFADLYGDYDTAGRVLTHAAMTPNPARARLVAFVENHFSTWVQKIGAELEWQEHETFARLGAAPFPDLLAASARSPAMILYLDQIYSFSTTLNENYAREVMELHTVGVHGGYDQADVKELARLLNGWTYSEEGDARSAGAPGRRVFRFDPRLSGGAPRRWFGIAFPRTPPSGRYDRIVLALEVLAARPETARFLAKKLAEHYVAIPAPESLVDDLARVFLETHGDLREVLLALARHPAFWGEACAERIAPPFDYAVKLQRTCGFQHPWAAIEFLQRSGRGVFDRATPDGYPEEATSFSDTNALLQRWRFAKDLDWGIANAVPWPWRWSEDPVTPELREDLVDLVSLRLNGRVLSSASRKAALDVLEATQGGREEVVLQAATLVPQLPESNLR